MSFIKRAVVVSISLIMFLSVIGFGIASDNEISDLFAVKASATSGTCGENLTWEYDEGTQTLTISGTGDMDSFYYSYAPHYAYKVTTAPWGAYREEMKNVIIDNGITNISNYAFLGCKGITNVSIPNTVKTIGYQAFSSCYSLSSITIPDSVTAIGEEAFSYAIDSAYLKIPGSVKSIGDYAFYCSNLKEIVIDNGVESIGEHTFNLCSGVVIYSGSAENSPWGAETLYSIYEGDLVYSTTDKEEIIYCIKSAQSVNIPNSVISIGDNAFADCKKLNSISIPDSVTSLGDKAFYGCPLEYVKMGSGLTEIPSTLINKDSLKTFIIGENVTKVGGFSGCSGLTSITIPGRVTSINGSAFNSCTGLTSITIPDSVTSIGASAFSGCINLATITLPDTITQIGANAFNNTAYYNNASNWSDNMLYIGNYLIKGKTDLAGNKSVKSGTTCIADSAFYGCNKIITLTVPTSVKNIGSLAFYNVTNVAYTGTATGSPWGARCLNGYTDGNFVYSDSGKAKLVACSGLATGSVVIPASTDTIGNNAFSACSTITNIYIPVNVTRIGNSAFSNTALSDVYYEGSTVDKLGISFGDNNAKITDATWHYNSKVSDMPQSTVYTLTYNANGGNGAPGNQTGSGYVSVSNSKPTRTGYTFLGWATTSNATSAQYDAGSLINLDKNITLYAVWQKNETPTNPDNPDNPPSTDIPEANIIKGNAANNQKTYDYKTTVTFTANVPEGGSVQWYVNGNKAGTDSTLTVKESTSSYTVKVVVTDKNGNQTMDEEQVTIKNGFFDKLIWFFVHLFNPSAYDIKQ